MSMASRSAQYSLAAGADYQDIVEYLKRGDRTAWLHLAGDQTTPREALFYLASNGDEQVRGLVAANPSAPLQANEILQYDDSDTVRGDLARKIGRLIPELPPEARPAVRERAIQILETLAQDQVTAVREMLVAAIKDRPDIPKDIILRLAEDQELSVCGPILEYSPLLSDLDLSEIIAVSHTKGALSAIARRNHVSGEIAAAITARRDTDAIATLLSNPNAQIREDTLDIILDAAPGEPSWHEPLALRSNISIRVMRRIAGFVASALVEKMIASHVLRDDEAQLILADVRKRLNTESVSANLEAEEDALATAAAVHAIASGQFNNNWIQQHISTGNRAHVIAALGVASRLDKHARMIINSRNAKLITALCWKAGLTARTAYDVQHKVAHIPTAQLIVPRGGSNFSLSRAEMDDLLSDFLARNS